MLLTQVKGIHPDSEAMAEYAELEEMANTLLSRMGMLVEAGIPAGALGGTGDHPSAEDAYWKNRKGDTPVPGGARGENKELPPYSTEPNSPGNVDVGSDMNSVVSAMEQVTKQMEAAKKAMGMLNKMGDSEFRTKHKSRVMGLMNKIRANLKRVTKKFDALLAENPELSDEINYDMNGGR